MKKTLKSNLFMVAQLVFMLVVPTVLIWLQYGEKALGYKIPMTAIILVALVFIIFKKIILNPYLKKIDQQVALLEINQLQAIDSNVIKSIKKKYRILTVSQMIFSAVLPILFFVLALITINAVQSQVIKLYGALVFCGISILLGLVFRVAEIYSLRCEHEK